MILALAKFVKITDALSRIPDKESTKFTRVYFSSLASTKFLGSVSIVRGDLNMFKPCTITE